MAVPAPTDAATRQGAAQALRQVYRHGRAGPLLEPYEHADGMVVVLGWFRKYPQERAKTLSLEQALAICND
jgi:hypothetical protein